MEIKAIKVHASETFFAQSDCVQTSQDAGKVISFDVNRRTFLDAINT